MAQTLIGYYNSICSLCNNEIRHNDKTLHCSCCDCDIHLSCSAFSDEDYVSMCNLTNNVWYCVKCIAEVFPFSCIVEDNEFVNYLHNTDKQLLMYNVQNADRLKLWTPSLTFDRDIDADRNFLKHKYCETMYCTESQFNLVQNSKDISTKFSVIHVNARSLLKNFENILLFIHSLNHKFSVIAISETWLDDCKQNFVHIDGYNLVVKHRENGRGGGVALYIDSSLHFVERCDLNAMHVIDTEHVFVSISLEQNVKVNVGAIYSKPDKDIKLFNDSFSKLIDKIGCEKTMSFILGDYNINLLKYENHSETNNFLNLMFEHHYFPLINRPTRFSAYGSTLIDNIFTNCMDDKFSTGCIISDISDHLPVYAILNNLIEMHIHIKKTKYISVSNRPIHDENLKKLEDKLVHTNWNLYDDDIKTKSDFEEKYTNFTDMLNQIYNDCIPIVTKKTKAIRDNKKPWITSALIVSARKKNKLYAKWMQSKNETDLSNYKTYKNKFIKILRSSQKLYYSDRFQKLEGDIKGTWHLLKDIMNNNNNPNMINELRVNGVKTTDLNQVANAFNDFFINIGPNLAKKIDDADGSYRDYLTLTTSTSTSPGGSFFLQPTSTEEITDIVHNLKSNKASGPDGLAPKVLKHIIPCLVAPLTLLFNKSFELGVFPNELKIAKISPIFKGEDKELVMNYRPISVLPVLSKVLERLMYNRLLNYFDQNDLLTNKQFGFREQKTTCMAITRLVDQISAKLDSGKVTIGVFIDLSKAFDTINHKILIDKLELYGVRGISLQWFKNYLTNRKQYVCVNNTVNSRINELICGVPQGSILGPLLFLIYINDIVKVSPILNMILFADDTNLFISGENLIETVTTLNCELCKLSNWFKVNKLSLNIKKTNYMIFHNRRKKIGLIPEVVIDNCKINSVTCSKFLGVIINENLTWTDHIETIKKKLSKNIGIIKHIKHQLSLNVLRSLYFTLINPYLEYCNMVWANGPNTALSKLF
jgi:hypothetical protein